MAEQVAGRVALGYVTYYGTSIPDAKYLTHINYAFAELYVKNGIYEKFGLQGDKSRFDKVKKIKSQYPHVRFLRPGEESGNAQAIRTRLQSLCFE